MTTAEPGRPLDSGPAYASLEEADAVIKLALEVGQAEEQVYPRVKLKAMVWKLTPTQAAQRILRAEHAQLAPEW